MKGTKQKMATMLTAESVECRESNGELIVRGWASAPVIDRSKEFVDGRSFDLSEYNANPAYLWCHNRQAKPLGRAKVAARAYYNVSDGPFGLFGEFYHDPNDEFAVKVYRAYQGGYLRGFSVGFKPVKVETMRPEEIRRLGGDPRDSVLRFVVARLYEISAVPIPDNQAALSVDAVKSIMATVPNAMRTKILAMTPTTKTLTATMPKA